MWDDGKIYEAHALAAAELGHTPHRTTSSQRGDDIYVVFKDEDGEVEGEYLVSENGTVSEVE